MNTISIYFYSTNRSPPPLPPYFTHIHTHVVRCGVEQGDLMLWNVNQNIHCFHFFFFPPPPPPLPPLHVVQPFVFFLLPSHLLTPPHHPSNIFTPPYPSLSPKVLHAHTPISPPPHSYHILFSPAASQYHAQNILEPSHHIPHHGQYLIFKQRCNHTTNKYIPFCLTMQTCSQQKPPPIPTMSPSHHSILILFSPPPIPFSLVFLLLFPLFIVLDDKTTKRQKATFLFFPFPFYSYPTWHQTSYISIHSWTSNGSHYYHHTTRQ